MKKILTGIALVMVLLVVMATPALAGSHHRTGTTTQVRHAVCAIEDCVRIGLHTHRGVQFKAHYFGDGHDYHDYCDITNCTLAGYHEHNGTFHFGHHVNDGHKNHRSVRGHH